METFSPRLRSRFAARRAEGRPALVAYLTAGDPSPDRSAALALAAARGGADVIELGVPFSDPIADGPVIQRASARALAAGTNVAKVLDIARAIRAASDVPIILFSYMNPLLRYGFERLCSDLAAARVDGCLFTDLSVEEADKPVATLRAHKLDTVFLAAPTSTERRLSLVASYSSGFVYVVSRTGVTGERDTIAASAHSVVDRLRQLTSLPIAVGFGISRPEHVAEVGRYADGAVVGSAFMRLIEQHSEASDLETRLESFTRELAGS